MKSQVRRTVELLVLLLTITTPVLAGTSFVYAPLETKGQVYRVPEYAGWAIGEVETTRLTPRLRVSLSVRIPSIDAARVVGRNKKTITVLFPFDEACLTRRAKEKLAIPPGVKVVITGYTCDLGPSAYNLGLSRRRAKAVASYLKRRGVVVLKAVGRGECCLVKRNGKIDRPASRRVVVEVE